MKKIALLAATFATTAILFTGCKKDEETPAINGRVKTLKTTQSVGGFNTVTMETYTYDSQNRLTEVLQEDGTGADQGKITYTYSSGAVVEKQYDDDMVTVTSTTNYTLNSSGLVTTDGTYSYTYNADGYLTSLVSSATTITNTYTGNNLTAITISIFGTDAVTNYTYDVSKTEYRTFGKQFLGKDSKNVRIAEQSNGPVINYVLTYDSKGRVTKEVIDGGSGSVTRDYTYFD